MLPGVLYRLAELEDADIVLECGRIPGGVLGVTWSTVQAG